MPRDRGFLWSLAIWTLLCAFFGARKLVDLDAVPLFLALEHQDLRLHQPPPPGFILHVWLAQVLHACGIGGFLALRLVSWLVLATAAGFLFHASRMAQGAKTARWAVVLFLTSPLVLYQGMTAGTFGDEALVASLTLFLCLRARARAAGALRFEAYLLGVLGGLRPTTLAFSLPMLVWTARKLRLTGRAGAAAALAWLLGTSCWLVPQADLAGGFSEYLAANAALLVPLLEASPLLGGPLPLLESLGTPLTALVLGLGGARLIASLFASPKSVPGLQRGLVLTGVVPVVLLGLLLGFRHSGAMLALWPLLCMALASGWSVATSRRAWRLALLVLAVVADGTGFFWIATPATRSTVPALQGRAAGTGTGSATESPEAAARPEVDRPGPGRPRASLLLARVDFFHDRTRRAPFDAFLQELEALPFPPEETLLLGGEATRAACVRFPTRPILHADPRRPVPFLLYRDLHPTPVDSLFAVPNHTAWLLLEGEPGQLVVAPPTTDTQRPVRPLQLQRNLHAFPIGRQRLDAWFTPRGGGGPGPPVRLHLWREGLLDDPALFERAGIAP